MIFLVIEIINKEIMAENTINVLARTKEWFELAIPKPTKDNQRVQCGVHTEEVVEMLESLVDDNSTDGLLINAKRALHLLAERLKKDATLTVSTRDRQELLDSLCDQIVTATGVAHMYGFDIINALAEVNRSNFSKFVDGVPVFNENGKITKGKDYTKPVLSSFVGTDHTI
jgi:predicted HAD superfamily Cof-like phosphohydrolase